MTNQRFSRKAVTLITTLILLILIIYSVDLKTVFEIIFLANWFYLGLGFLFYFMIILIRAYRFKILLKKISFFNVSVITMKYTLMNYIMPFKTGEFSFVYLAKKQGNFSYLKGFSVLIITRLFDFVAIVFLFFIGLYVSEKLPFGIFNVLFFSFIFLFLLLGIIILLVYFPDVFYSVIKSLMKYLRVPKKISYFVDVHIRNIINYFKGYKSIIVLLYIFISSLFLFLLGYLSMMMIIIALGSNIHITILALLLPLLVLSTLLPINSLAGIGTYEGVWVLILSYYGYTPETALSLAIAIHLVQIFYIVLVGILGWMFDLLNISNHNVFDKKH